MYDLTNFWARCKRYNRPHAKFNISITLFPDGLRIKRYHDDVDVMVAGFEDSRPRDNDSDSYCSIDTVTSRSLGNVGVYVQENAGARSTS